MRNQLANVSSAYSAYSGDMLNDNPHWLASYSENYDVLESTNGTLTVEPFAGYADRIKGVVSIFILAVLLGRAIKLDWTSRPHISDVIQPNRIPWLDNLSVVHDEIHYWNYRRSVNFPAEIKTGKFLEKLNRAVSGKKNVKIRCNQDLILPFCENESIHGSFGSVGHRQLFRFAFAALFKPNTQSKMWPESDGIIKLMNDRETIGVHIRVGGMHDDPTFETEDTIKRYQKAVEKLIKDRNLVNPIVYLASDSLSVKQSVENGTFLNEVQVVQQNIKPVHMHYAEPNSESSDSFRQTIMDHYILSLCDHIVHGRGAFGYTAHLLGDGSRVSA